ncbi:hypothetical protein BC829DRAFT_403279 [Chytridium lagenaria]|nr:hypothetical protein BC829DRAFT_403279 [Chytridium lagenaria]
MYIDVMETLKVIRGSQASLYIVFTHTSIALYSVYPRWFRHKCGIWFKFKVRYSHQRT